MVLRIFRRYLVSPRRSFFLILLIVALIAFFKRRKNYHRYESAIYERERNQKGSDQTESYISISINRFNSEETILNKDVYGTVEDNTLIFVIFVDKYSDDFKLFLKSISEVSGIEDALIIFSHSFFNETINKIIGGIKFCRVLQIFYPFSLQTHPATYPGFHPSDCHANMDKKLAEKTNCTGAYYPDIRGHYRNPINAEKKHYWWWTTNHVFENLNLTTHTGLFIFMEDDYILMPDFIYMITFMKSVSTSLPQYEFLSMGSSSVPDTKQNIYAVEFATWDPKFHSGVLAFDYDTWNIISSHYDLYCELDDTSWSRSLNFISFKRRGGNKFKVMSTTTPRAFKIVDARFSMFGYHDVVEDIMTFQKVNELNWFPPHLELYINVEIEPDEGDFSFDYSEIEGGWADPRDKLLCQNITSKKIKKVLMELGNDLIILIM